DAIRQDICVIHLRKRGQNPEQFDLALLASTSEGFSGAEIEQVVVSGLYNCAARAQALSSELLVDALEKTRLLSVVMSKKFRLCANGPPIAP
ncbi:MAG: ATP-dependent 26S proteasome regulatory subunit, partial [Bermanella sp.]